MLEWMRALAAITLAWAVAALLWQVAAARGRGRTDHSEPRGSAMRGVVHNFTTAMLPSHKESARLYPLEFGVGMVLHLGVLLALAVVVLVLIGSGVTKAVEPFVLPVVAIALLAAYFMLVRRLWSPTLAAMSAPDDFVAIAAVIALLTATLLHGLAVVSSTVLLGCAVLFFAYLPLGKLRHAIFFFVVRADLGRRLGRRGVFPSTPSTPFRGPRHVGSE